MGNPITPGPEALKRLRERVKEAPNRETFKQATRAGQLEDELFMKQSFSEHCLCEAKSSNCAEWIRHAVDCSSDGCGVVKAHIIMEFVEQVERRAELKMLSTGKLEGAHYAAMKEIAAQYKSEIEQPPVKLSELRGISGKIEDGKSSEELIREQRDEW
jgi:hypothetical protein